VSLRTYVVTVTGFRLLDRLRVLIKAWPVIASNTACLLMSGAVLVMKWRFDGESRGLMRPFGRRSDDSLGGGGVRYRDVRYRSAPFALRGPPP
jgi:hypothetical protein